MKTIQLLILSALALCFFSPAHAEITLLNQNDWKVGMYGFIEFDSLYDTTRGFVETAGNTAVPRKGTFAGDDGRTQFSIRNTRLGFTVGAPEADGWATRAVLEMDFLGYDPTPTSGTGAASTSEAAFYSNPTLRVRHAYFTAEKNDLQVLVGQTWSLFGWQPAYDLASISVNPDSGTLYQRTVRVGAIKTLHVGDDTLQAGLSIERPSERDGKVPNVVVGARYAMNALKSGFNGPNSDVKAVPASIAFTGTYRDYSYAVSPTNSTETESASAYAASADVIIPVIPSSDGKDVSGTLTLAGEFTIGKAYGDEFPSWSGGLGQSFAGAAPAANEATANNSNIDPGLGGFNNNGVFTLVDLRTFNAQMQYHINTSTWITVGYGQLFSSNMGEFVGSNGVTASGLVDKIETKFAGISHDITSAIRVGVEWDQYTSHYVADGATNFDNRYMVAMYFRF